MMENKLKVRSMEELGALFGGNDEQTVATDGGLMELPAGRLVAFGNTHPFNSYNEEKTASMVESIREFGVLEPLIVRLIPDSDTYEIIAGHNRRDCAVLAGLATVPCIIKEVDNHVATLIMIASNLNQREKILPSERARAYKLQFDTLDAMGVSAIADEISEAEGLSKRSINKYLRLNYLIIEFMDMVDDETLTLKIGIDLSFLASDEQEELFSLVQEKNIKLNDKHSARLKELSQSGKWDLDKFLEKDFAKPKTLVTVSLTGKRLERFFPKNTAKKEIEQLIFSLLEEYFSKKSP